MDPACPARQWPLITGSRTPIAERMRWDDWYLSTRGQAYSDWLNVKQHTMGKQVA